MKTFYKLLGVALLVITTNNFVWFALTYWAYLSTQSVIATSTMGGVFLVLFAVSGIWLGSIVDHHKKKTAMLGSSIVSLLIFVAGFLFLRATPPEFFSTVASVHLWLFITVLLCANAAGSIYNIAIPTLVAILVPEKDREKANGMFATVMGISFGITSVASGITLAYGGMDVVLMIAIVTTLLAIITLALIPVREKGIAHVAGLEHSAAESDPSTADHPKAKKTKGKVDLKGTIAAVRAVPGLFALIFFTTFNNFLGGAFMALMDAYGLSLVSVQTWGTLWGILSFSFILGGMYIAKKGLGGNPLWILMRNNLVCWTVCIFFTIQPSIILLAAGTFIWMFFVPFIEAIENTIFQKVVPVDRLGRVIGFAHSVEQSASPLTAFMIGPIAQFIFIPFMTTGRGVDLIGGWFGTGTGRGIALVFMATGIIGLLVTLIALHSKAYALLHARFAHSKAAA